MYNEDRVPIYKPAITIIFKSTKKLKKKYAIRPPPKPKILSKKKPTAKNKAIKIGVIGKLIFVSSDDNLI